MSVLFEIVRTPNQQKSFEQTWEYFCLKFGWNNDPYSKNGVRYNLLLPGKEFLRSKKILGTVEFTPYEPNNTHSTVEGRNRYKFSDINEIMQHRDRVWEIDKLCLHKNYHQLGYFSIFMKVFDDHNSNHKPKFYIALVEKKLYKKLRILLGSSIEKRGESLAGPTTSLAPVIIKIEEISQNPKAVDRLLNMVASIDPHSKRKSVMYIGLKVMKRIFNSLRVA